MAQELIDFNTLNAGNMAKLNRMFTELYSRTQNARVDGSVVEWSTEPGWSVAYVSVGVYDVTFPTAAESALTQVITVNRNQDVVSAGAMFISVNGITATGCQVRILDHNGAVADSPFGITRNL